jgi:hypothetical protein
VSDLVTKLRAELDEDERVNAAIIVGGLGRPPVNARVLRWVAAAREILDRHAPYEFPGHGTCCETCSDMGAIGYPCLEVKALAAVCGDSDG